MNAYAIRPVDSADFPQCAAVIRESFLTVAEEFGLTEQNCPSNGAFLKDERLTTDRDEDALQYGLYADGRLVGFMELKRKQGALFTLEKLAVLPGFRHQGYGAFLLDFARAEVLRLGGEVLSIGIIEENTRLKEWYLRHGFVHTGTKQFAHLPFTVGFLALHIGEA